MPISKEERASQAAKHLSFVKGVFSKETDESVQSTIIYEDGEARSAQLPEPNADSTTTNVTTAFATSALHNASGKIALVDAASFTRPGGAYEDGSFGPEQVLCSESNLYPVLQGISPSTTARTADTLAGNYSPIVPPMLKMSSSTAKDPYARQTLSSSPSQTAHVRWKTIDPSENATPA